jgi:hypothetical protein
MNLKAPEAKYSIRFKILDAADFFSTLTIGLIKKLSQTYKTVKLKIHTTLKHITNKKIVLAQFFE